MVRGVKAGCGLTRLAVTLETVRGVGGGAPAANVAVTLLAASRTTAQPPVPVQAPLQPVKVELVEAVALRPTLVPLGKLALQVAPQLIPLGLEVTVPVPVPALATVRGWSTGLVAAAQASLEYGESPALL
jgi:hypothetical protein